MGSREEAGPEEFSKTKTRIDEALAWLKKELVDMRQQDVTILRQLNQIQQTIHILTNQRRPRTLSASSLSSPESLTSHLSLEVTPSVPGMSRALRRLGSLPVSSLSVDDDDDDVYVSDDDELAESFDSIDFPFPERRKLSTDSVGALCTLPRGKRPSLANCAWPSIPEDSSPPRSPGYTTPGGDNTTGDTATGHPGSLTPEPETEPAGDAEEETSTRSSRSHWSSVSSDDVTANRKSSLTGSSTPSGDLCCDLSCDDVCSRTSRSGSLESTCSSVVSPTIIPVQRKINKDYEVSYEKLLQRSSQIWREVQTQQLHGGVVEDRKMAALKLFL